MGADEQVPVVALTVNGEPREIAGPATVAGLVDHLGCGRRGVAVAVNGTVVPRSTWERTELQRGDTVEVLHAVQGGC
jgi:sulfur carrier protein